MNKVKLTQWMLRDAEQTFQVVANVPGDITYDLFQAGKIRDPYVDMNYKDAEEYLRKDFEYISTLKIDNLKQDKEYYLVFDGIDTFAEVYIDGVLLGKTKNMFLQYRFNISDIVKNGKGEYEVKVLMKSTLNIMDTIDCKDYFGVFNLPRMFIRKAQCHFGWDWAPNLPGHGIWQDVYVSEESKYKIDNVNYIANLNGGVVFQIELNYNIRSSVDNMGRERMKGAECKDDKLRVTLSSGQTVTVPVYGKKNVANLFVENPRLWYPLGYGEHPLYDYTVELFRDGEIVSVLNGRFAFRTVEIVQEPLDAERVGYAFKINGEKIFVKGSNWVPTECFSGVVTDDKYKKLIRQAVDGNLNMLRVWGGGIYEKDIFYNLCDENGLLVWQDFMFACSDIPEEDEAFVKNVLEECEYQIKRLRTHPSIVYWCGSNEKTGAYGLCVAHGDYFANIILQGLVNYLDGTRPYKGQSPCSLTDVGNDLTTGECHYNSLETSLVKGIDNYRKLVAERVVPLASECAVLGPCSEESFKKFFSEEILWPMNEVWVDRISDNPYAAVLLPFCEREVLYMKTLYGEPNSLKQYIAMGTMIQEECLRAEIEFARRNNKECSGVLNWMYTDIWPTATWAIVDYYGEPKGGYYQEKRSFKPALFTFTQNNAEKQEIAAINDYPASVAFDVEYGQKSADGKVLWKKNYRATLQGRQVFAQELDCTVEKDSYLYAKGTVNGEKFSTVYSPLMWRGYEFSNDFTYTVKQICPKSAEVTISANKLAKSVFLTMKDNYKYTYSDNYVNVDAGERVTVKITCEEEFDVNGINVKEYSSRL